MKKDKCPTCGGSKSNLADDYFIKKCWCDELQSLEGDSDESDET